jgi:hypothetical protein
VPGRLGARHSVEIDQFSPHSPESWQHGATLEKLAPVGAVHVWLPQVTVSPPVPPVVPLLPPVPGPPSAVPPEPPPPFFFSSEPQEGNTTKNANRDVAQSLDQTIIVTSTAVLVQLLRSDPLTVTPDGRK